MNGLLGLSVQYNAPCIPYQSSMFFTYYHFSKFIEGVELITSIQNMIYLYLIHS